MKEDKLPKQIWLEGVMSTKLTAATKCVAWCIANRAYGHKTESNPSYQLIAVETGIHPNNIKRYIGALEEAGWIVITQKTNSIKRPYNNYKMIMATPNEGDPQSAYEDTSSTNHYPQSAYFSTPNEGGISNKEVSEEVMEEVSTQPTAYLDEDTSWLSTPLDDEGSHSEHIDIEDVWNILNQDTSNQDRAAARRHKQQLKREDFATAERIANMKRGEW